MATHFCDLDGTLFLAGTQELAPDSRQFLDMIKDKGDKLIIVTRRGDEEWKGHAVFSEDVTLKALKDNDVDYDQIVFNVNNPRIIYDDNACRAITVEQDRGILEALSLDTQTE